MDWSDLVYAAAMKPPSSPDRVDNLVAEWARTRPQTKVDAIQIVGRIIWLGRRYEDAVVQMLWDPSLSYSDYDVIATLRRAGAPYELTPTELGRRVLLSSGGITACLRRLEDRGLVSRRTVPEDRRRLLARLTPKGFDLIDAFVDQRFEAASQALSNLGGDEVVVLEQLLRRLGARIDDGR